MMRQVVVAVFVGGVVGLSAQVPIGSPATFEVASVKASTGNIPATWTTPPRGTVTITNAPLRAIITRTYGIRFELERFMFEAPSNEVLSARFDIIAKPPDDARTGQTLVMLKNLLAERFKLRVHTETRESPVYALTLAREGQLGQHLRRSDRNCEPSAVVRALADSSLDVSGRTVCRESSTSEKGFRMISGAGPIALLVGALQRSADRPLVDSTGLTGTYEWQLRFQSMSNRVAPNGTVEAMFTAVEDQLGLKVQRRMGPVDVLVIDSVERPTPD